MEVEDEIFGETGGIGSEVAQSLLRIGVQLPVADKLGDIFAGVEAGIKTDERQDVLSFFIETSAEIIRIDVGALDNIVSELMESDLRVGVGDGQKPVGVVGEADSFITVKFGASRAVGGELKVNLVAGGGEIGEPTLGN